MFSIGHHVLDGNLLLAPMAGVSDVVFRQICLEQGAVCAASEMISSDTTLHATEKTRNRILKTDHDGPHIVQIAGSDPDTLLEAARHNVKLGADIIDINMGCPAKKVCKKLAGSALLSDEKLVDRILCTVVSGVDVPVTLKIRTGPSPEKRNGVRIAQMAERNGIQCLVVHGRTREDKFKGDAEYDTIRDIKQAVNIPVVANGDIADPHKAQQVLDYTGADALMIGRAAQGDPFIFSRISHALNGKPDSALSSPDASELQRTVVRHLKGIHSVYGEYRGVRVARKHISWYMKNKRDAAQFRQRINEVESASDQLHLVDAFFAA